MNKEAQRTVRVNSKYGWIIDKVLLSGSEAEAGTSGPSNIGEELTAQLANGQGKRFRMRDDDKVTYYEGRIVGTYTLFEPLDDFGAPNAGCTTIEYQTNGKWEVI